MTHVLAHPEKKVGGLGRRTTMRACDFQGSRLAIDDGGSVFPCAPPATPLSCCVIHVCKTGGFASPSCDGFALDSSDSRTCGRTSCKLSQSADVGDRRRCEALCGSPAALLTAPARRSAAAKRYGRRGMAECLLFEVCTSGRASICDVCLARLPWPGPPAAAPRSCETAPANHRSRAAALR
jgi:hypothetical protein